MDPATALFHDKAHTHPHQACNSALLFTSRTAVEAERERESGLRFYSRGKRLQVFNSSLCCSLLPPTMKGFELPFIPKRAGLLPETKLCREEEKQRWNRPVRARDGPHTQTSTFKLGSKRAILLACWPQEAVSSHHPP